ncbi:D-serine dehydratase, partial [Burkholderia ubonensis]
ASTATQRARVSTEQQGYRARMQLDDSVMRDATHVIWATGGGMVPEAEMNAYLQAGRQALAGS